MIRVVEDIKELVQAEDAIKELGPAVTIKSQVIKGKISYAIFINEE